MTNIVKLVAEIEKIICERLPMNKVIHRELDGHNERISNEVLAKLQEIKDILKNEKSS